MTDIPVRTSGWLVAARIILGIAAYATVAELFTVTFRTGFEMPEQVGAIVAPAYEIALLLGIPVVVLGATIVGIVGGRPRRLGVIARGMVLVAGVAALVSLFA